MKIQRCITKLGIGVCALVIPALGILIAVGYTWSVELAGLAFFSVVLAATLGAAAFLSWACVRHGGMSVKTASILPAVPFAVIVASVLPALALGFFGPVLLWSLPFVLALILGRRAALSAQYSPILDAEQVVDGNPH